MDNQAVLLEHGIQNEKEYTDFGKQPVFIVWAFKYRY